MFDDKYKEVKSPTTGIYKEKGSKFTAYSYPVYSEEEIKGLFILVLVQIDY